MEFLNQKLNIPHGDISPNNILVSGSNIKIADFEGCQHDSLGGVIRFRAPELFVNVQQTNPFIQDIWSLGMVLVYLSFSKDSFSGQLNNQEVNNYADESELDLIYKTIAEPITPNFENELFSSFAINCLEKNPMKRSTAQELLLHSVFKSYTIGVPIHDTACAKNHRHF